MCVLFSAILLLITACRHRPLYLHVNDTKQSDVKKLCQRVIRKQLNFSMNVEIKYD